MADILDFAGMGLDEAVEPEVLPGGEEYKLRIIKAHISESGYLVIRMEAVDHPAAKEVSVPLQIPKAGMDAKALNRARLKMNYFREAFEVGNVDDVEDLVGLEGYCVLRVKESEDFGEQNEVARFVSGH